MASSQPKQRLAWRDLAYWLLPPPVESRRQRRWRLMRSFLAVGTLPPRGAESPQERDRTSDG